MELIRNREWGELGLRSAVVALVLAYAWLGAFALEARIRVSDEVFDYAVWVENGRAQTLQEASRHRPTEVSKIAAELGPLEAEIRVLGGLKEKIELTIHFDQPAHYHVSEKRIEIGRHHAQSRGQLSKAVYKAWLLQNASPNFRGSILYSEVISDSLLAMFRRGFSVEILRETEGVPSFQRLELPKTDNWLNFASSFQSSCGSPWASLELRGYCGTSDSMNPLSFRPLLTSMVLEIYKAVPPLTRMSFIRSWAEAIRNEKGTSPSDEAYQPEHLVDWRDWLRYELFEILPIENILSASDLAQLDQNDFSEKFARVLLSARITSEQSPLVEYAIHGTQAPSLSPGSPSAIGDRGDVKVLLPAEAKLTREDLGMIGSRYLVWRNCDMPSVSEVLKYPVTAERIIYIHACGSTGNEAKVFVDMGPKAFLANHKEVPFVQMQRRALELAVKNKVLKPSTSVVELMRGTDVSGRGLLGLEKAEWAVELKAFRVLGAIEAVEFYRSYGAADRNGLPAKTRF